MHTLSLHDALPLLLSIPPTTVQKLPDAVLPEPPPILEYSPDAT
jgi:hypothetical protein